MSGRKFRWARRRRLGDRSTVTRRSWSAILFETPGGAALITMVMGGVIATTLTSVVQARMSERTLRLAETNALMKERGEAAREVYSLTGRAVAHCREVLALAQPEFKASGDMNAETRQGLLQQRAVVRQEFNNFVRDWNTRKGAVHLSFMYYYPHSTDPARAWIAVEKAGSRMIDCAGRARDEIDSEACVVRFNEFDSAAEELTTVLQNEWQSGWLPLGGTRADLF